MTDKSRKLEDHSTAAVKTTRGHPVSHQHQMPAPGLIPTYTIPAELPRHAHIAPYLAPSFVPHPLTMPASIPTAAVRPGGANISNDLGPPIFMPSLNLGVPKSAPAPNKTHKGGSPLTISSSPSPLDVVSPSTTVSTELFANAVICHAPYSAQSVVVPPKTGKPGGGGGHAFVNSVRKPSKQDGIPPVKSSAPNSMGMSLPGNMSISLVKPTLTKSSGVAINVPLEASHVTYSGVPAPKYPTSPQYGEAVHVGGVKRDMGNKGFIKTDIGYDPSYKDGGGGIVSGANLVCTEGVSTNVSSPLSTHSRSSSDQQLHRINHHYTSHEEAVTSGNDNIPWPEAMSKNIIIPAPNLTGRDIANLTSSASSPLSNDKDVHWPTTPTDADNDVGGRGFSDVNKTRADSPLAAANNHHHHPQDGSQSGSGTFNITSAAQGSASSPRPSILRKRPLESTRSSESLISPSSSVPSHLLPRSSLNSPSSKTNLLCNETSTSENHLLKDNFDTSSPRKRPRKQQFESVIDGHSSSSDALNSHKFSSHSMIAHERLPGPVPFKNKGRGSGNEEEWSDERKPSKEKEVMYISQLRKSPYPVAYINKKTYRGLHKHFRRHADIKHHENQSTSVHETCSCDSTWIRSSGWKLHQLNIHLRNIENLEKDTLVMMEDIEQSRRTILELLPEDLIDNKSQKDIQTLSMDTKERTKRSLLHMQETQENMIKILDTNVKVIEIMKKFASQLPVSSSVTSTLIPSTSQN